jgi:outer membrane protein OmpA-like peptidoglycan-associated protein
VGTLQRNLVFFGLGGAGPDRGQVVYSRFAQLAKQYGVTFAVDPPSWETVFNKAYLQEVLQRFPALAQADPALPTFVVASDKAQGELSAPQPLAQNQVTVPPVAAVLDKVPEQELTYHLPFVQGQATFAPEAAVVLDKIFAQIVMAGDVPIEIHGYTDGSGLAKSNWDLSRRRGEAVYNWLQRKLGAAFPKQVLVVPHGGNDLLVQDQIDGKYIPELMAQNRRVVLKIGSTTSNP